MRTIRKAFLLLAIIAIGAVDVCIYWSIHLNFNAENVAENGEKVSLLKESIAFYPLNYDSLYELGLTYFDLATNDLTDGDSRDQNLQRSIRSFKRSIGLNPGYYKSHFYLAQAIIYMRYFSSVEESFIEEYKKAALLTNYDRTAHFEVGKTLFSLWSDLTGQDRRFVLTLLEDVIEVGSNFQNLLQVWAMDVRDYKVMKEILPEKPDFYRKYAKFLGEISLSLEERQAKLSQAEYLDFIRAKHIYTQGQKEYRLSNFIKAMDQFKSSLNVLEEIRFYQDLTAQKLIDFSEFMNLRKDILLKLAKSSFEQTRNLREAESYFRSYLDLEDVALKLIELESYFKEKNVLGSRITSNLNDLTYLSLKYRLNYKLSRYREIMREGKELRVGFVPQNDASAKNYAEILQLIGDSFQKADFVYDAENFYQKAAELDPDNLDLLLRMKKNYERLNEYEKIQEVDKKINSLFSPAKAEFKGLVIGKAQTFSLPLVLDGSKVNLIIWFQREAQDTIPLVAVFFNGPVIWEKYLEADTIILSLNPRVGANTLEIMPINRAVNLKQIECSDEYIEVVDAGLEALPEKQKVKEIPVQESTPASAQKVREEERGLVLIHDLSVAKVENALVISILSDSFSSFLKFELSNPNRIVVDLLGVDDIQGKRNIEVNDQGVQAIKLGMFKPNTARVVIYFEKAIPRHELERMNKGLKLVIWQN